MRIARYNKNIHFDTIASWVLATDHLALPLDFMPEDSTFVAVHNGEPVASVCLMLTNSPMLAIAEGLIARPGLDVGIRREAVEMLNRELDEFAKYKGKKLIQAFSPHEKLTERYEQLGYRRTVKEMCSVVKELI